MSGVYSGVQAIIREKKLLASYIHCASHCLKLTIAKAATAQSIRNAQGIQSETVNFVKSSAKRSTLFNNRLNLIENQGLGQKLKSFCETRWVEHHDPVIVFCNLNPAIIRFLNQCLNVDADTSTKARMPLTACYSPEFIISIM